MKHDAIVVGSGPNGLAAAITLQQAGLAVLLLEAKATVGGGMRTAELTLPGFQHDVCSAVHPMALESPLFASLPLARQGLEWIHPPVLAAQPFDDGTAAALHHGLADTVATLGPDAAAYRGLLEPLVARWPGIAADALGPLGWPKRPWDLARFGLKALPSARAGARRFAGRNARGLWAGMAAHTQQPFEKLTTSAVALSLLLVGHRGGWPLPRGGSQRLAEALAAHFVALGGEMRTGVRVTSLAELPETRAVLFDVTPRQLLQIAGPRFSAFYRWQLGRYRYGMGVFKVDWALAGPVPFAPEAARQAGTLHLGGTYEEVAESERRIWAGENPEKPFVLFVQPSRFDPTRAPAGQHTAWGYCHVPPGSTEDRTEAIERQVERFAPGFQRLILARHTMNSAQFEAYNANYVGGDINGGVIDLGQLFTRPALRFSPYRTSAKGLYLCSASTPPGGGVHGLCGWHAARRALRDVFGRSGAA